MSLFRKSKFMRLLIFSLIALCVFSFSCEEQFAPGSEFEIGDTITINLNETRYNEAYQFALTYDSLLAESRCAMNVVCIWQGNATVQVSFKTPDETFPFELHTLGTESFPSSFQTAGLTIQLVSVAPYPCVGCENIRKEDEAIVVVVTK